MNTIRDDNILFSIKGGAGLNSSMLNAIIRTISTLYSIGQAVGSALRRTRTGRYC